MLKKIKEKLDEIILAGEEFLEKELEKVEDIDQDLIGDIQVHLDETRALSAKLEEKIKAREAAEAPEPESKPAESDAAPETGQAPA